MNATRPSDTKRGKQWLMNFAEHDRSHAQLLIDSLYIPSTDEIRQAVKTAIRTLPETNGPPQLLLPVLSMEDIKEARLRTEPNLSKGELKKPQIAYQDFHPGSDMSSTPGSEALIGNVLRELSGNAPSSNNRQWLHPGTSIEDLRRLNCRTIILVTDYAGSGRQMTRYAEFLTRNRTIRSWRSLNYIRILAVMHSASRAAMDLMNSNASIDAVSISEIAPSFSTAEWTTEERAAIEQLCRQYVSGGQALGFDKSAGLLAMHSGIPNNLPMVTRKQGANWHPFFEGRTFPQDLARELPSYRPDRSLTSLVEGNHQFRVAKVIESGRLGTTASQIAACLALIRRGTRTISGLAAALGMPISSVESLWYFLEESGMISGARLTPRGIRELSYAKALPRRTRVSLAAKDEKPYYPQRLR